MSNSGGVPSGQGTGGGALADLQAFTGAGWNPVREPGDAGDGLSGTQMASVHAYVMKSAAVFDRRRTPDTFKVANVIAAANTTLWTPAAGKKFRLMGGVFMLRNDATLAVAGPFVVVLQDQATNIGVNLQFGVPAAASAIPGATVVPFNLGNGVLSSAANNVLNAAITSNGLTAGVLGCNVFGTEE